MQFSAIINFLAIAGLVSSAPCNLEARDAEVQALEERATPTVRKLTANPAKKIASPKITIAPRPVPRPQPTSTSLWTSVPITACPTSVPVTVGAPNFNTIPSSCGQSWLDIVNMWRKAYNKPAFAWSPHAASVAYGAAFNSSGGAKQFVHSNLGFWNTAAEVESPGYVVPYAGTAPLHGVTPFSAAIINWMCEVPTDVQLNSSGFSGMDLCTLIQKNVDYIGENPAETGHHDIMLGDYSAIGCAFVFNTQNPTGPFAGVYVCDFQF